MTSKSPALPLFLLFLLAVAPIFRLASNGFTLFQVIPSHLDFVTSGEAQRVQGISAELEEAERG